MSIILFLIFIPRTSQLGHYWSKLVNSLYLTYGKSLFVIGITFLILPSLFGCQSIIKLGLDNKITNFISKVSFFTYLIHLNVVMQWANSRTVEFYYSLIPLFGQFVSHSLISLGIATWLTLIIEVPFSKIQKTIMKKIITPN